jgi:hypothetical protein
VYAHSRSQLALGDRVGVGDEQVVSQAIAEVVLEDGGSRRGDGRAEPDAADELGAGDELVVVDGEQPACVEGLGEGHKAAVMQYLGGDVGE